MTFNKLKDVILVALATIVGGYVGSSIKEVKQKLSDLEIRVVILEHTRGIK